MEVQLQELYFSEVDSGRLMYEDDPEYERRRQALSSCLDRLEVSRGPVTRQESSSSPSASSARLDSSAFLFRLPLTR